MTWKTYFFTWFTLLDLSGLVVFYNDALVWWIILFSMPLFLFESIKNMISDIKNISHDKER